ncbi:MAG TPA: haloacid dehalogenase-like hydrolase [Ktedonobacterales bacterium]|nr:haloacid dehalogenase-like hydrolase [Ktedonobacterales bacterium]
MNWPFSVNHVVLWDVDGTLVRARGGRVSVNAFLRALSLASGLPEGLPYPKDAGGKTDEQIALEVLLLASIAEDRAMALLPAFRDAYLALLHKERDGLSLDLRVLPGVPDVLARLQALDVCQSLLTGNLEPIARLKLACAGLDQFVAFELGGYGSDHRDRDSLVPIVRQRLQRQFGPEAAAAEIVVVGDTPRDIACARAGGARVLAVATGNFSRAELAAHHPDALVDDLTDTDAIVNCLLGNAAAVQ